MATLAVLVLFVAVTSCASKSIDRVQQVGVQTGQIGGGNGQEQFTGQVRPGQGNVHYPSDGFPVQGQVPVHGFQGHLPGSQGQIPAFQGQVPVHKVLGQLPVHRVQGQVPSHGTQNQAPLHVVPKQVLAHRTFEQVPAHGVQGQVPLHTDVPVPFVQPGHVLFEHGQVVPIGIISQDSEVNPDGTFHNVWEAENGIKVQEEATVRLVADNTVVQTVTGQITYTDNEGKQIVLTYVADENGFHPAGEHIPTPPPVPLGIARGLEWIRAHPPAETEVDKTEEHTRDVAAETLTAEN